MTSKLAPTEARDATRITKLTALTDEQIAEWKLLLADATPGPWQLRGRTILHNGCVIAKPYDTEDAEFIAAAPEIVSTLLTELARLQTQHTETFKALVKAESKSLSYSERLIAAKARLAAAEKDRDALVSALERTEAAHQGSATSLARQLRETRATVEERRHEPIRLGKQGCGTRGSELVECAVCIGEPWPCAAALEKMSE